jgi:AcrR family transcriptional regulator
MPSDETHGPAVRDEQDVAHGATVTLPERGVAAQAPSRSRSPPASGAGLTASNIRLKHMFVNGRTPDQTRQRLLDAATELFAAQGFHGTTVREIAQRAGVNLAAGNYHFGSKRALYLEVLRQHFARVQAELRERGAAPDPAELARLGPRQLRAALRTRIQVMFDRVVGPSPGAYALLMQREMADPSEAMPVIVREFIRPMMRDLEAVVARLAPGIGRRAVAHSALSIVGQTMFYRFAMPAVLRVLREGRYTRELTGTLAAHVTRFSLGGLAAVGSTNRRRHAR